MATASLAGAVIVDIPIPSIGCQPTIVSKSINFLDKVINWQVPNVPAKYNGMTLRQFMHDHPGGIQMPVLMATTTGAALPAHCSGPVTVFPFDSNVKTSKMVDAQTFPMTNPIPINGPGAPNSNNTVAWSFGSLGQQAIMGLGLKPNHAYSSIPDSVGIQLAARPSCADCVATPGVVLTLSLVIVGGNGLPSNLPSFPASSNPTHDGPTHPSGPSNPGGVHPTPGRSPSHAPTKSHKKMYEIIGGVLGGLLILVLIATIVYHTRRRVM